MRKVFEILEYLHYTAVQCDFVSWFDPNIDCPCYKQVSRCDCNIENYYFSFSTKTYVVGAQKSHLSEMVLLST